MNTPLLLLCILLCGNLSYGPLNVKTDLSFLHCYLGAYVQIKKVINVSVSSVSIDTPHYPLLLLNLTKLV